MVITFVLEMNGVNCVKCDTLDVDNTSILVNSFLYICRGVALIPLIPCKTLCLKVTALHAVPKAKVKAVSMLRSLPLI